MAIHCFLWRHKYSNNVVFIHRKITPSIVKKNICNYEKKAYRIIIILMFSGVEEHSPEDKKVKHALLIGIVFSHTRICIFLLYSCHHHC